MASENGMPVDVERTLKPVRVVDNSNGCTLMEMGVSPVSPKPFENIRAYNVGKSNYAKHKIQPWDIWLEYNLNPWDADIVKRVLREKEGEERTTDYEKIIHICKERIRQLKEYGK